MDKKTENFKVKLQNCNTDIGAFLQLFNIWSDLTIDQRGELIDEGVNNGNIQLC